MTVVASIVEGDGEVAALPVLLRRLCEWQTPEMPAQILPPIRVRRDRFLNRDVEFRRHLMLAAAKCGDGGWVLILLDADDDCPATIGQEIKTRAELVIPHRPVSVVLANREYEAWYIAAAPSLQGIRGLVIDEMSSSVEAERIRNAKGWLGQRMSGGKYREVADQPAFAARMDLSQAFNASRSFRKLCNEWNRRVELTNS